MSSEKDNGNPSSLHPLTVEQGVKAMLETPPPNKGQEHSTTRKIATDGRGGKATTMDERGGISTGVFGTPKVVSCVLALAYPRVADIRRRSNQIEDALAKDYESPQTINAPDDIPDVPRLIFPSKDERSAIAVSQTTMQLNMRFMDGMPSDIESVSTDVGERYRGLFDAFTSSIKGIGPLFFGVTTQVRLQTTLTDAQLMKRYARSLLKSDEQRGYFDVLVKRTKITDKLYFNNLTLSNYRTFQVAAMSPDVVLRFPANKAVERGIEIIGDFNDRFAYNQNQHYRTSVLKGQDIVQYAIQAVKEAIKVVEAM